MKSRIKLVVLVVAAVCLLILPLLSACAAPAVSPGQEKVFKVGSIMDLSGPISCCGITGLNAIKAYFNYLNDDKVVPGWKFEVISWDTRYDAARAAPGYRYCMDKGANLIQTAYAQDTEAAKPMGLADKVLTFGYNTTAVTTGLPSWSFTQVPLVEDVNASFFNWVIQNWDYKKAGRKPIVAQISWDNSMGQAGAKGAETFCKSKPDKLDWAGNIVLPPGTMDITQPAAEFDRKKVDYVFSTMVSSPTVALIKLIDTNKYTYKVGMGDWAFVCFKSMKDRGGPALAGHYWITSHGWHTDDSKGIKFMKEILNRYYSPAELAAAGQLEDPCGHIAFLLAMEIKTVVANTLKAGGNPYNGDDMYKQTIKLELDSQGIMGPLKYTETKRWGIDKMLIYQLKLVDGKPEPVRITDWFDMTPHK